MGKKIGFTYDLKKDHALERGLPEDAFAEFDTEEIIEAVAGAIESGGHTVVKIGNVRNLLQRIHDLDVDIVFNICEGIGNRNRESEVPVILDLFKIPFVGSDGLTLGITLDKVMAKKAFICEGIPTPKYFVANKETALFNLDSMKFPLIVKPRHEGSSKGISEDSIICDRRQLKAQVDKVAEAYQQPVLVEEFISGSEFTILVIGNKTPEALRPVQIKILGKLELGNLVYTSRRLLSTEVEYICPPKISEDLEKKLCELALAAYRAVDCRDFGRVDFRVDGEGHSYVLEVNPLPSLSLEDIFPIVAKVNGLTYNELILKIINTALSRYGLN